MIKAILKTENRSFVLENFQSARGIRENENRPHLLNLEITPNEFDKTSLLKLIEYLSDLHRSMQEEPVNIYLKNARDRFSNYIKMVNMNTISLTEVDNFLTAYDNALEEIKRLKNQ